MSSLRSVSSTAKARLSTRDDTSSVLLQASLVPRPIFFNLCNKPSVCVCVCVSVDAFVPPVCTFRLCVHLGYVATSVSSVIFCARGDCF